MVKRAKSSEDITRKKFTFLKIEGELKRFLGNVERSGSILIMGDSGHGKTALSFQIAKEFGKTEKIIYNTCEEGARASFQTNFLLNNVKVLGKNFNYVDEDYEDFNTRLRLKRQPNIGFIDSAQYYFDDKKKQHYMKMVKEFDKKLLIFLSHYEKGRPVGAVAERIKYDAQIVILVKDWKAHIIKTRCGSDQMNPYIINKKLADERELKLLKQG